MIATNRGDNRPHVGVDKELVDVGHTVGRCSRNVAVASFGMSPEDYPIPFRLEELNTSFDPMREDSRATPGWSHNANRIAVPECRSLHRMHSSNVVPPLVGE